MKICKQCLFTSETYPEIQLNGESICDICEINEVRIAGLQYQKKSEYLDKMLGLIKSSRKAKYDCLIGISGGTDSSYLVYLAQQWGLNPLLLHVDGGWNSEIAVINIERIVENSGFDLITEVLPWDEIRDVQRSFILANVLDVDLPFDNAMLLYNYVVAQRFNIKYVLNGFSADTEGIMPNSFTHYKLDRRNIMDIHKKHGKIPLNRLKFLGTFNYFWLDRVKKIKFLNPLDWIEYNKFEANQKIKEEFAWQDYEGKHYENIFTRFYQGHILPMKFNIDKRVSHLSMLICSRQITKAEALEILASVPIYPNALLERDDQLFFLKKLQIPKDDFEQYMVSEPVSHREYKSDLDYYDFFRPLYRAIKRVFKFRIFIDT